MLCEVCNENEAGEGDICAQCATRWGRAARAQAVIVEYERQIRANQSPEWDTIVAVAECRDGVMGALGEVFQVAVDVLGVDHDTIENDYASELEAALERLQAKLKVEVAARGVCVPIADLEALLVRQESRAELYDGVRALIDRDVIVVHSPTT